MKLILLKKIKNIKLIFTILLFSFILFSYSQTFAITEKINYQGKLYDNNGNVIPDDNYNFKFKLCTTLSGNVCSDNLWEEEHIEVNRIPTSNGLFSVLLGETTSLSAIDFNQTLYLEINIGGSADTVTPTYETLSPAKELGSVPTSFYSKETEDSNTLDGIDSSSFLRSDIADTLEVTDNSNSALTITQLGSANSFQVNDESSDTTPFVVDELGNVGIGVLDPSSKLEVDGNIKLSGHLNINDEYIIPNSAGTDGQVLIFPSSGTSLVWADISSGLGAINYIGDSYIGTTSSLGGAGLTSAPKSILIGDDAGYSANTGLIEESILIGDSSGYGLDAGLRNIFLGNNAGYNLYGGTYNMFLGYNAGNPTGLIEADYNTIIGHESGTSVGESLSGENNLFVGYDIDPDGTNITWAGSNQINIGDTFLKYANGQISIAGATAINDAYVLPSTAGTDGQVLSYPSSGNSLEWTDPFAGAGFLPLTGGDMTGNIFMGNVDSGIFGYYFANLLGDNLGGISYDIGNDLLNITKEGSNSSISLGSSSVNISATNGMKIFSTNNTLVLDLENEFDGYETMIHVAGSTPEGVITESGGSLFFETNGADSNLYLKKSATVSNTGWEKIALETDLNNYIELATTGALNQTVSGAFDLDIGGQSQIASGGQMIFKGVGTSITGGLSLSRLTGSGDNGPVLEIIDETTNGGRSDFHISTIDPEGSVNGVLGSLLVYKPVAGTPTLYLKESDDGGNTGWVDLNSGFDTSANYDTTGNWDNDGNWIFNGDFTLNNNMAIYRGDKTPLEAFPNSNAALHIFGTNGSGNQANHYLETQSDVAGAHSIFNFRKSRDTGGDLLDGDDVGSILFQAYNGGSGGFGNAGRIIGGMAGNATTSSIPMDLKFQLAGETTTLTDRMVLNGLGGVTFSKIDSSSSPLRITNGTANLDMHFDTSSDSFTFGVDYANSPAIQIVDADITEYNGILTLDNDAVEPQVILNGDLVTNGTVNTKDNYYEVQFFPVTPPNVSDVPVDVVFNTEFYSNPNFTLNVDGSVTVNKTGYYKMQTDAIFQENSGGNNQAAVFLEVVVAGDTGRRLRASNGIVSGQEETSITLSRAVFITAGESVVAQYFSNTGATLTPTFFTANLIFEYLGN